MSTTWASKISAILSPTRSYIACMSSSAARPCWTLLMIASSAARSLVSVRSRFVSSNRRAFSRATPRLEASVDSSRSSASLKACAGPVRDGKHTEGPLAGLDRGREIRLRAGADPADAGSASASSAVPRRSGRPVLMTCEFRPVPERDGLRSGSRFPSSTQYGKRDQVRSWVEDGDRQLARAQDLADPVADGVDDRLEVELHRQGGADLVDDRQLGVALLGFAEEALRLVEQADVLERDAQARGDARQEPDVRLAERVLSLQVLDEEDPADVPAPMIGTKRADFASSPVTTAGWPASAARAARSRLISTGACVSTTCRRKPMSGIGSAESAARARPCTGSGRSRSTDRRARCRRRGRRRSR